MADAFSIKFDPAGLIDTVQKMGEGAREQVRPAAQAGAQVLYDEVLMRVPVSGKGHWFHGTSFKLNGKKYWFDSGTLRRSIYQVFSKDNSGPMNATYHLSWNHFECPYGYMVERGTSRAPAHPFLRPSFDAKADDALQAAKTKFEQGMREVIAKVST